MVINLGKTQRKMLEFMRENPQQWDTLKLQERLEMTSDQCLNTLRRLFKRGLVMRVLNGKQYVWSITPEDLLN